MKRRRFLILVAAVLMIGSLAGCGDEVGKTDETVTQESLFEDKAEENDVRQDETSYEMPDWLAAYVDYVEGITHYYTCGFFYVDGDDIPEFIIGIGTYDIVLTFHDGEVDALQTGGSRTRYIEKKNLLCDTSGQAGEYVDQVYSIENGKWTYVAGGKYISEFKDGSYVDKFSFEWEGEEVERELYWESLHHVFDEKQAIVPMKYIRWDNVLSHIEAGDFAWVLTAKPYTYTYDDEIIDDFEYSDEYIPISKVDFASCQNEMSEEDWQVLSSFFPILLEGKTFMAGLGPSANEYTDDFKEYSLNNLYASWIDEYPDEFILDKFTLCDLTGDGQKELVVYCNFAIGIYCIFHKEGDDFYVVCMPVRWFEGLQKNGIYIGSGGAGTGYIQRLHFLRDVFWGEEIARYHWDYYEIGGKEVSETEMEAWADEMMVGEAVWYDVRADWGIKTQPTPDYKDQYGSVEEFFQYESNSDNKSASKKTVSKKSVSKKSVITKAEEGYELTIYNSLGAIILSEVYPKEPGIRWVTENVMEIAISAGSPARYVYYVDLKEDKVSDVYFNPVLVGDKYIAYMEDGELILSDIFYTEQQDLLYMAIVRDFTETADPVSAIVGMELIDSENIELTYLTGNDYTVVTEIISINRDTESEQSTIEDTSHENGSRK